MTSSSSTSVNSPHKIIIKAIDVLQDKSKSDKEFLEILEDNFHQITLGFVYHTSSETNYQDFSSPAIQRRPSVDGYLLEKPWRDEVYRVLKITEKDLMRFPNTVKKNDFVTSLHKLFTSNTAQFEEILKRAQNSNSNQVSFFKTSKDKVFLSRSKNVYLMQQICIIWLWRIEDINAWKINQENLTNSIATMGVELDVLNSTFTLINELNAFNSEGLNKLNSKIRKVMNAIQNVCKRFNIWQETMPYDVHVVGNIHYSVDPEPTKRHLDGFVAKFEDILKDIENKQFDNNTIDVRNTDEWTDFLGTLKIKDNTRKFNVDHTATPKTTVAPNTHPTSPTQVDDEIKNADSIARSATVKKSDNNSKNPTTATNTTTTTSASTVFRFGDSDLTKQATVVSKSTNSAGGGGGGGGDDSSDSDDDDDIHNSDGGGSKIPPEKNSPYNQISSPHSRALENLKMANLRAKTIIEGDDTKAGKTKINLVLDDLKKAVETARTTSVNHNPPTRKLDEDLRQEISKAYDIQMTLTEMQDGLIEREALRKQLPSGSWPSWKGNPDTFLDFKTTMEKHLQSLSCEALKLSTLKAHMIGDKCAEIKRDLTGVTTLKEALTILTQTFGNVTRQLPNKLDQLQKLKLKPDTEVEEVKAARLILEYCRFCVEHGASHNINQVFVVSHYKKLMKENAKKMKRFGEKELVDHEGLITFLKELVLEDNEYMDDPYTSKNKDTRLNYTRSGVEGTGKKFPCLICNQKTHFTYKCPELKNCQTLNEKKDLLKKKKSCFMCLREHSYGHKCEPKFLKFTCKAHKVNVGICMCKTKKDVEEGSIEKVQVNSTTVKLNNNSNDAVATQLITEVLYLLSDDDQIIKVLVLYDLGSTNSGIDHQKANEIYGPKQLDITLNVENFVTGVQKTSGNRRTIRIKTQNGIEEINLYGVEGLKQTYEKRTFKIPKHWVDKYNIQEYPTSPSGTATLVIGMDHSHLLPKDVAVEDGIMLLRSRVTGKLLLGGKVIEQDQPSMNSNRMSFHPLNMNHRDIHNAITTDGIQASRIIRCESCVLMTEKCTNCKKQNQPVPKHQVELTKTVKENLLFDTEQGRYFASYLYNDDLVNLPVNDESSLRMMKNFERKLLALGLQDIANKQFSKLRKSVIKSDTEDPLPENLQRSYIVMCYSLANNPMKNTQVRLCMNSSFKQGENSVSLNECQIDGPSYLNDLNQILTRWRLYK